MVWFLESLGVDYETEVFLRDQKSKLAPPALKKVHPIGHAPIVTITPPAQRGLPDDEEKRTIVLAESAYIMEYLIKHLPEHGSKLLPKKQWKDGLEGMIGGETDDWMRYEYYMQYVEGSLAPIAISALLVGSK